MSKTTAKFVLCFTAGDYPASLQKGKLYRVIKDTAAEKLGYIRIVDDSNEDYLYDAGYFESVDLSRTLAKKLLKSSD